VENRKKLGLLGKNRQIGGGRKVYGEMKRVKSLEDMAGVSYKDLDII